MKAKYRSRIIAIALVLALSGAASAGWLGQTSAQDDGGAEATIAALQTQVWSLQTQVAVLSTPFVAAPVMVETPESERPTTLAGDALSLLSPGVVGIVDVIAIGDPVRGTVPIALRNNTGSDVLLNGVLGVARDSSGALAFSGDVSTFAPTLLPAEQVAVGTVYFGPSDLPDGLAFEFEPKVSSVDETNTFKRDLEIAEATQTSEGLVGIARNASGMAMSGPFSVIGVCFTESGGIQGYYSAYAAKNTLAPGETTPFTATFYGTGSCRAFLLGSTGYIGF